jgi:hypothetical protein
MNMFALFLVKYGGFSFLFGFVILLPITWIITGRYFDNVLGFKDKFYNPVAKGNIFPGFLLRAAQYSILIVLKKSPKKSYDHLVFGETNFRNLARKLDVYMSFILFFFFYGGFGVLLIGTGFFYLDKFLTWLF